MTPKAAPIFLGSDPPGQTTLFYSPHTRLPSHTAEKREELPHLCEASCQICPHGHHHPPNRENFVQLVSELPTLRTTPALADMPANFPLFGSILRRWVFGSELDNTSPRMRGLMKNAKSTSSIHDGAPQSCLFHAPQHPRTEFPPIPSVIPCLRTILTGPD